MKETGIGWHRDCDEISYKVNNIPKNKDKVPSENLKSNVRLAQYYFFTLSFTYTQLYDDDVISFAHAIPYTYNYDLMPFLDNISNNHNYHGILRIGTFCRTLARND